MPAHRALPRRSRVPASRQTVCRRVIAPSAASAVSGGAAAEAAAEADMEPAGLVAKAACANPAVRRQPCRRLTRPAEPNPPPQDIPTAPTNSITSRRLPGNLSLHRRRRSRKSRIRRERHACPVRRPPGKSRHPAMRSPQHLRRILSLRHPRKATRRERASLTWSGRRPRPTEPPRAAVAARKNSELRPQAARCARKCATSPLEAASMRSKTSSKPFGPP